MIQPIDHALEFLEQQRELDRRTLRYDGEDLVRWRMSQCCLASVIYVDGKGHVCRNCENVILREDWRSQETSSEGSQNNVSSKQKDS